MMETWTEQHSAHSEVSASHDNGPNAVLMVWESLHFCILEQTALYSLLIYRPDAKACAT